MYTWDEINQFISGCQRCPLHQHRRQAVIGWGDCHSQCMLIAEAPGVQEDRQGIPFVGPSGQLLDEMLSGIGLERGQLYITNLVKCHPVGNRDPQPEEQLQCLPYLRYETALLKPKVIVCLGRIAAQRLIDPKYRITRQHGEWIQRGNYWLTAIYHPSAVLRDPTKKNEYIEDFIEIRRRLDVLKRLNNIM